MVCNHVYADVHGHDHAPELDGSGFRKLGLATILKAGEASRSGNSGARDARTTDVGTCNTEFVGTCSKYSGDAASIGASSNNAVEVSNNSGFIALVDF